MNKKLRELQAKKAAASQAKADNFRIAGALLEKASAENRALTAEEQTNFDAAKSASDAKGVEIERFQAQIDVEQELIAANANAQGVSVAQFGDLILTENVAADPCGGFRSEGEFFRAVFSAAHSRTNGVAVDQRLLIGAATPSTFGGEGVGQDGGFAIPPQFSTNIFTLSLGENALLPYTDDVNIDGNAMSFPKDETTPWGTNGVRAYWQGEVTAATPTKPALGLNSLRLKKLMALVPISDEMLADTSALGSYLPKKIAMSIQWKTNDAILFGAGGPLPYGALNSGAAVVVAKDASQATNTLSALNLANMIARLPEGSFPNAIWIINNNVLPALFTLTLGNYPIYLPNGVQPGGIQGSPYGTLLGRPIIVSQHAKSFSSQGDVNLVDLSYYQAITKAEGIQTATSMHLYFDADATAFRTTFRMDGQSKLSQSITPNNGSLNLSPFVQLAAR